MEIISDIRALYDWSVLRIIFLVFFGGLLCATFITLITRIFRDSAFTKESFQINMLCSQIGSVLGYFLGASTGAVGAMVAGIFGILTIFLGYLSKGGDKKQISLVSIGILSLFYAFLLVSISTKTMHSITEERNFCDKIFIKNIKVEKEKYNKMCERYWP